MGNIALQIERTLSGNVASGESLIFESMTHVTGNISYDNATGGIIFMEPGRYIVNWFIIMQSADYAAGTVFTLSSPDGGTITGNSNTKTGEVVGTGILEVSTVPITFTLQNAGAGNCYFSDDVPVKALLVVTQDNLTEPVNARCFAVDQMAHILFQMLNAYSDTTWTVYTESLYAYSGMPLELYTAPNADKPGLLRLIDANNDYEAIPIEHITAIYPGDGTIYDPDFTYLTPPDSISRGCSHDFLASVQSYLPVGTAVTFGLGPAITASGDVYRSEYGVIVLSDTDGNTPIFIPSANILRIFIVGNAEESQPSGSTARPRIKITY